MGLFDKKICNICGEKIGLLGNRKLDDGNLCKDCAKKLSPWFEERRHSSDSKAMIFRYRSCISYGMVPSSMALTYPLMEVRGERKS